MPQCMVKAEDLRGGSRENVLQQRDATEMGTKRLWGQNKALWDGPAGRTPVVAWGMGRDTGEQVGTESPPQTIDGFPECLSAMASAELVLSQGKGTGDIPFPGLFQTWFSTVLQC